MTEQEETVTMEIRKVVKPSFGTYSILQGSPKNITWRWAYNTSGVLGLDDETKLFAYEGALENLMKGPFIVLPKPQAFYRDNDFFQACVAIDPIGRDVSNAIDEYAHFEWVNKFRCYVALKDFNGIKYKHKQTLMKKLEQEIEEQTLMLCIFFYAEDDETHPELIVIDNKEKTEESEESE